MKDKGEEDTIKRCSRERKLSLERDRARECKEKTPLLPNAKE